MEFVDAGLLIIKKSFFAQSDISNLEFKMPEFGQIFLILAFLAFLQRKVVETLETIKLKYSPEVGHSRPILRPPFLFLRREYPPFLHRFYTFIFTFLYPIFGFQLFL